MKKIISFFIIITIIFSSLPLSANADTSGFEFPYENLLCESIYVKEITTNNLIYAQNEDIERDVSSLAMMMTAIVAIENISDIENTMVTFTQDSSNIYAGTSAIRILINPGDTLSIYDYLNIMLIPSDVESAGQIAAYYNETQGYTSVKTGTDEYGVDLRASDMSDSPFVQKMNETAQKIGCLNTVFMNPSGYYNANAHSTAYDMALILEYAMKLPYFNDIVKRSSYRTSPTVSREDGYKVSLPTPLFSLSQYNGRYYNKYAIGAKTGKNTVSGNCIAVSATDGDYTYIAITLGAPLKDEFGNTLDNNGAASDATRLVNWCFNSISKQAILEKDSLISEVSVKNAWGKDSVQLVSSENVIALLPNNVLVSHLDVYVDTPEYIESPIEKGQVIARASIYYEGRYITGVDAVAKESIGRSQLLSLVEKIVFLFTLPQFYICLLVLFGLIALYISFAVISNKKKKNRKVRKMPSNRKRKRKPTTKKER